MRPRRQDRVRFKYGVARDARLRQSGRGYPRRKPGVPARLAGEKSGATYATRYSVLALVREGGPLARCRVAHNWPAAEGHSATAQQAALDEIAADREAASLRRTFPPIAG